MNVQSLKTDQSQEKLRFVRNVVLKAIFLFILINLAFAFTHPLPYFGHLSAYNRLFPGRERLPYGDFPKRAYNLSLFNLDAMFASHELAAGPKPDGEYRVLVIGDSSTWGFLLQPGQTLAAQINAAGYRLPDGRQVRAYNLGYPVMSLTKDLLILSYAMHYQPDLILWPLTLESFPYDKQLYPPLLQRNPVAVGNLISKYHLHLDENQLDPAPPAFWDRTILGARRPLADLIRLQLYGVMWAATGIDQDIPSTFTPRQEDLSADLGFHNLQPPHLSESDLAFEVLKAGIDMAGDTPILFVNEPMFISRGENSDIRYNFYYPRWAYDDYRRLMDEQSRKYGWHYHDLWDAIPLGEFTNSAVHVTPKGEARFAQKIGPAIVEMGTAGGQ